MSGNQGLVEQALIIIAQYGSIDGAHHKQWVIDQVLRCILADNYQEWVNDLCVDGEVWDTGIAP